MKAAIYSRKSRYTGKGESIENQIQLCKEHGIKYLDIKESDFIIYEDEGFSGGNTNRPQFKKMLKDAKAKNFDILICYRLDRISRNVSDFSHLIEQLNKYDISFVSIREQFDTTTPMGRAMMYIASVFSQLERETIAERIRDNMMQLAKTGRWLGGSSPTGYRSEPVISTNSDGKETKMYKLTQVAEEIDVVKTIYNKYLKYRSITKVEQYLVENDIRTKNGVDFHRYAIKFILSNPAYAIADKNLYNYLIEIDYDVCSDIEEFNGINGLSSYNRTKQGKGNGSERFRERNEWIIAVGLHEGVIESDRWIEVQTLLEQNKSKSYRKVKSTQSLLSGILRCSNCGSYMRPKVYNRINSDGERVFYYLCELKEKSKKKRCDIPNVNGNNIDKSVINELKKIAAKNSPVFSEVFDKKTLVRNERDTLQAEIDSLKTKIEEADLGIDNLVTAIARGQKDEVLTTIFDKMEVLTNQKKTFEKKLAELQDVEKVAEFNGINLDFVVQTLGNFNNSSWELMDVESKRNMIKSIVDKIIWDGKKVDMLLFGSKILEMSEIEPPKQINTENSAEMLPQCEGRK